MQHSGLLLLAHFWQDVAAKAIMTEANGSNVDLADEIKKKLLAFLGEGGGKITM